MCLFLYVCVCVCVCVFMWACGFHTGDHLGEPPLVAPPDPVEALVPLAIPLARGNISWDVPGGRLVWTCAAESLDAHCNHAHHQDKKNSCRVNRTRRWRANGAQGRPIGLLLLWLSKHDEFETRTAHQEANKSLTAMPAHERQAQRSWAESVNLAALDYERPRRPGEPPEPEALC